MLIRTRADKVILSFLLIAGLTSCIAGDGYVYQRPSIPFRDGFQQVVTAAPSVQYVSSTAKPAVVFAGEYQRPVVLSTSRPQFSGYQGLSQSVYQKPKIQVPIVSAFPGFASSSTTPRPAIVSPTVSFSGFVQKPVLTTTTFGQQSVRPVVAITAKPLQPSVAYLPPQSQQATLTVLKPQNAFQGFTPLPSPTRRPVSVAIKPQISFSGFQSTAQTPAVTTSTFNQFAQAPSRPVVVTGQYQRPAVSIIAKPAAVQTQQIVQSYLPPQVQQTTFTVTKPQVSFPGFTGSSITRRPVISTLRPQTSFSGLQSTVQRPVVTTSTINQFVQAPSRPAVVTGQYQRPAVSIIAKPAVFQTQKIVQSYIPPKVQQTTFTVAKPQLSFPGFTGSSTTRRPVIATLRPQTSFSGLQSIVQRPSVTSTINQFVQAPSRPAVVTGQYQRPAVSIIAKPAVFQTQKIVQSYIPPKVQQTTFTVSRPQAAFQGLTTLSSPTPRPVIATLKPQTSFNGLQSFGQSIVQRPAVTTSTFNQFAQAPSRPVVVTGQYQRPVVSIISKPATFQTQKIVQSYIPPKVQQTTLTVSRPQATFQGFAPLPAPTPRPVIATLKPQISFSGFQPTVQRPAVTTTTFNQFAQAPLRPAVVAITAKPAVVQTQQIVQSYIPPKVQQTTLTVSKPQVAFQGFTSPSTVRPQNSFNAFQSFGQSSVQRPVVTTSSFSQVGQPTGRPLIVTGQYQRPQVSFASTVAPQLTNTNLEYLPPAGAKIPLNAARAAGSALSSSDFDFASATANQVVDVAQEQKVGGFVAPAFRSGLQTSTNQLSNSAQEQTVAQIDIPTAASQGQTLSYTLPQQSFFELPSATVNQVVDASPRQDKVGGGLGRAEVASIYTPVNSASPSLGDAHHRQKREFGNTGFFNFPGPQQFHALHPQTYQALPPQPFFAGQLIVLPDGSTFIQSGFPAVVPSRTVAQRAFDFNAINRQQQKATVNLVSSQLSAITNNHYESQTDAEPQVQDPQPLNHEELQARQLVEKADSEKEENIVKYLEPGSNTGPHVNQRSDKEYNVFDYDQYSIDPDENEA